MSSYLLPVPDGISGRTELYTEDFEAALLLATDGKRRKPIWSKPYRADVTELLTERESVELQYILTRANTFGARLGPDGAAARPIICSLKGWFPRCGWRNMNRTEPSEREKDETLILILKTGISFCQKLHV